MSPYSTPAIGTLNVLTREIAEASTTIMVKMEPGFTPRAALARQTQASNIFRDITQRYALAAAEILDLGSSVDCLTKAELDDIIDSITNLFEDAAHKAWRQTERDAGTYHLEAAE